MATVRRRLNNPVLFICDLQEKFRNAIYEYPKVIATTQKMLRASQILSIPVLATTQQRAKLGGTCSELHLDSAGEKGIATKVHADKSAFSMWVPEVQRAFHALPHTASHSSNTSNPRRECIVVGIEAHICVTQTTLDLLAQGQTVYVLADAVSSCNPQEVPIALARLRAAGAIVTTSESFLYECMGDSAIEEFRAIAGLVRETKDATKESLGGLCKM